EFAYFEFSGKFRDLGVGALDGLRHLHVVYLLLCRCQVTGIGKEPGLPAGYEDYRSRAWESGQIIGIASIFDHDGIELFPLKYCLDTGNSCLKFFLHGWSASSPV